MTSTLLTPDGASSASPSTDAPARVVDPGRRLPGGRALLGGVLVACAALGLFAATRPRSTVPATSYLVARRALTPGHRLQAADLGAEPIDLPGAVAGTALPADRAVVGSVVLQAVPAGALLPRTAVTPGKRAKGRPLLSFSIEPERAAAGDLVIGDRVDVLVTWGHAADGAAADNTQVVGHDLEVVAVAQPAQDALGDSAKLTLSVAAPQGQALVELTRAIRTGELTIVRTTGVARR